MKEVTRKVTIIHRSTINNILKQMEDEDFILDTSRTGLYTLHTILDSDDFLIHGTIMVFGENNTGDIEADSTLQDWLEEKGYDFFLDLEDRLKTQVTKQLKLFGDNDQGLHETRNNIVAMVMSIMNEATPKG